MIDSFRNYASLPQVPRIKKLLHHWSFNTSFPISQVLGLHSTMHWGSTLKINKKKWYIQNVLFKSLWFFFCCFIWNVKMKFKMKNRQNTLPDSFLNNVEDCEVPLRKLLWNVLVIWVDFCSSIFCLFLTFPSLPFSFAMWYIIYFYCVKCKNSFKKWKSFSDLTQRYEMTWYSLISNRKATGETALMCNQWLYFLDHSLSRESHHWI